LAQNKSWFQKALGYFYFKVGKGEGFGVKDVKIGPAKADIGVRWNGKDFKQTTKGMQVTTVNSEAGVKVELGPIKLGVQRTNTQEEGQPAKVEWLPGFEFGKAEGTNSEVGIGGGGCFLVCGQVEVGVQMDKVLDDVRDAVGSAVERVLTQPVSQ
jgi:hypothetical protein